jgi:hypothetical protein
MQARTDAHAETEGSRAAGLQNAWSHGPPFEPSKSNTLSSTFDHF